MSGYENMYDLPAMVVERVNDVVPRQFVITVGHLVGSDPLLLVSASPRGDVVNDHLHAKVDLTTHSAYMYMYHLHD